MSIPTEFAARIPLAIIIFIVSAGLIFTAFFPFDVISFDYGKDGFQIPSFEDTKELNSTIANNYRPGILLRYLSEFPNGLIQILLLSLIPGAFLYLLQDAIAWLNGKIMRGKLKGFLKKRNLYVPFPIDKGNIPSNVVENARFTKWLKENNYYNFADIVNGLKYIPAGCFFAFETLTMITVTLFIAIIFLVQEISPILLNWTIILLILTALSYLFHLISETFVNKKFADLHKASRIKANDLTKWIRNQDVRENKK